MKAKKSSKTLKRKTGSAPRVVAEEEAMDQALIPLEVEEVEIVAREMAKTVKMEVRAVANAVVSVEEIGEIDLVVAEEEATVNTEVVEEDAVVAAQDQETKVKRSTKMMKLKDKVLSIQLKQVVTVKDMEVSHVKIGILWIAFLALVVERETKERVVPVKAVGVMIRNQMKKVTKRRRKEKKPVKKAKKKVTDVANPAERKKRLSLKKRKKK